MSTNGIAGQPMEPVYQRSERTYTPPTQRPQRTHEAETANQAAQTGAAAAVGTEVVQAPQSTEAAQSSEKAQKVDTYEPGVSNRPERALSKEQVQQIKAEMKTRMYDLVQQTISRQITGGRSSRLFDWLRNAQYTIEDAQQAKRDVSEDGVWGVEQTSDRIVKMAQALTNGDPSKLNDMIDAFEKGYKAAEKAMGGSLPGISQKTREAVLDKFQAIKDQYQRDQTQQVQQTKTQTQQTQSKTAVVNAAAGLT